MDQLWTELELRVSCKKLPNGDIWSKSDPLVFIDLLDPKSGRWDSLGSTEMIKNNNSPDFKTAFRLKYKFEEAQELWIRVFDADSNFINDIDKHDKLGEVKMMLGDIVVSRNQSKTARLLKYDKPLPEATITLCVEEVNEQTATKDKIKFEIKGDKLPKMDGMFGKSDPYLIFFRLEGDGKLTKVHTTEVIPKCLDPKWKPLSISIADLVHGDLKRNFLVQCFDSDKVGKDQLIGEFVTNLDDLLSSQEKKKDGIDLKRPNKSSSYGKITFTRCEIDKHFTFNDWLKSGIEFRLMVAIDFTGSNGHPQDSDSLHFLGGGFASNPYQQAIKCVGEILTPYDTDNMYAAWGFGAKIAAPAADCSCDSGSSKVSHCFPLTLDEHKMQVKGVKGILDAYSAAMHRLLLSGPTHFEEVIRAATKEASRPNQYSILLIITDGEINDEARTQEALRDAEKQPLSIITVGVGNAAFKEMHKLDGDKDGKDGKDKRSASKRDIFQFVPFNDFKDDMPGLGAAVLAEVPRQLLDYMKRNRIAPPPRPPSVPAALAVPAEAPKPIVVQPVLVLPPQFAPAPAVPVQYAPLSGQFAQMSMQHVQPGFPPYQSYQSYQPYQPYQPAPQMLSSGGPFV